MIRLAKEDAPAGSNLLELVPPTPVGGVPLFGDTGGLHCLLSSFAKIWYLVVFLTFIAGLFGMQAKQKTLFKRR
jgi:hypothetical protein